MVRQGFLQDGGDVGFAVAHRVIGGLGDIDHPSVGGIDGVFAASQRFAGNDARVRRCGVLGHMLRA